MNFVNPSYSGAAKNAEIGFNLKSQWSGVEAAPETQSVFFGTSLGRNVGMGVTVINDKTFIESQVNLMANFSYKVALTQETNLFFGVSAGANSYKVNTDGLFTFGISSDPSLTNLDNSFNPNIGAGVHLQGEKFFLSYSIPKLLTSDRLENTNGTARLNQERLHMYLAGGYDIRIGMETVLKPSVMTRYIDSSPLSIDLTGAIEFSEKFEFGATYRFEEAVGGYMLVQAARWVQIGYSYQSPTNSPVSKITNGSHEIFIKFDLLKP